MDSKLDPSQRKIMTRKYKIDEGLSKYVEQTTLLEPHNYIPGWEGGDEEKKEVSVTLAALRKNYDSVHKMVVKRERELQLLKKQIEQVNQDELLAKGETIIMNEKLEDLGGASFSVRKKHEVSQMDQKIYYHMLDRMKKDLIAMKLKTNDLKQSMKNKDLIVASEDEKNRKSNEQRLQSKFKLDNLIRNVDQEQKKRQERIQSLQKSIKNKEEAVQRRMERVRRQQEIADAAANENKDSDEKTMRDNFMVQKLWAVFLKRKMENEMRKSAEVEDAFQTIRAATGMTDIHSIVQKFLTREQTYSQLLINVVESERKIDSLKKENEELMKELHDVMIDRDGIRGEGKKQFPEVEKLTGQLTELNKELEECKDRSQKVEIISDQVYGWTQKVLQKMIEHFSDGRMNVPYINDIEKLKSNTNLDSLFDKICDTVCDQLEQLITEEASEEERYIHSKEFMNDFASEDFIQKNIRIRPLSGRTNADESQKQDYNTKTMGKSSDGAKKDHDDVRAMMYEIEQQRKLIKEKKEESIKKKKNEIEKLKKQKK